MVGLTLLHLLYLLYRFFRIPIPLSANSVQSIRQQVYQSLTKAIPFSNQHGTTV